MARTRKRRVRKVRDESEEKTKRGPSFKRQVREIYQTSGKDKAVTHAYECGIKQARLLRWLKVWSEGKITSVDPAPVRVSTRRKLVELWWWKRKPRDKRWIGALLEVGPEQSIILLTECPHETLRGTQYCVPNYDYQELKDETKKERRRERLI